jgi:nucleotide-binding universal stress UspA family protein
MFKRILVPLDGSAFAEQVLPTAEMLAKCGEGEIELVRVAIHPSTYVHFPDPTMLADLYDSDQTRCVDYLKHVADDMADRTGLCPHTAVLEGPVADCIVDYATEIGADLIVMSTHGRTGMERWLLGSVAEKVVRGAHGPVLLIRPQPGVKPQVVSQPATRAVSLISQ